MGERGRFADSFAGSRRRYTVREASELLRISQHAIRQRIWRNTLESTKGADGRVYVLLEQDPEPSGEASDEVSGEQSGVDLVQMLREHNQVLREQLAEAHAANRENRRIIAALTQRIPEIEAPRDMPQSTGTASEANNRGRGTSRAAGARRTPLVAASVLLRIVRTTPGAQEPAIKSSPESSSAPRCITAAPQASSS
jgi:hypothetical protein